MPNLARPPSLIPLSYWRSLGLFNLFRICIVAGLVLASVLFERKVLTEALPLSIFYWLSAIYAVLILLSAYTIHQRQPRFHWQLSLQISADIVYFVTLLHLAGGMKSGVGIMLLPYLAAAGLVSRGRTTLFHAALASIALLIQQGYSQLTSTEHSVGDWVQAGQLATAYFAIAWLAHRLARYATESEQLAEKRGIDLANLAMVNELIIQDVSDGVLVLDDDERLVQHNQRAERMLGCYGYPLGLPLRDYSAQLAEAVALWHVGDQAQAAASMTIHSSGCTLRLRFMPIHTARQGGGLVLFLEDIDRLQQEAQQLKLVALGRLTANIAHEIRNPLGAISHAAQLLAEDSSDAASRRLSNIIVEHSQRLDRMVQDVLALNRRDRARRDPIPLIEWLPAFLTEFRQIEGIAMAITWHCPSDAVVLFDPEQLHQVLWNLCRNGWRHSRQSVGSLRLEISLRSKGWALTVLDDGPGVAPEHYDHLFEPFFTTNSKGTGLGLYLAREICLGNGAMLQYIPQDQGAAFRIDFES